MENKNKRVRQSNWTVQEEMALVQGVIDRYDALFGNFKGSVRGQSLRAEAWKTISEAVNAVSLNHRSVEGVEKKFTNIKQSAKSKCDEMRHPPTGGGRPPTFTPAEQVWVEALEARKNPSIHGVIGGVDVNENCVKPSEVTIKPCEYSVDSGYSFMIEGDVGSAILEMPCLSDTTSTVIASSSSSAAAPPQVSASSDSSSLVAAANIQPSSSMKHLSNVRDERRKRKKITNDRERVEMEILNLEKQKLLFEIDLIKEKKSVLEQRKNIWDLKEKFYKKMLKTHSED